MIRLRHSVAILGLIALTAACAAGPDAPLPTTMPPASSGAPLPIEGRDWFFHEDQGDLGLVYGVAESDDVSISLDCRAAVGRVGVSVSAPRASSEIMLESGGDTERLEAASQPSMLHDGVILTAEADADAPVFQRFRRVGWLALWQDGQRLVHVAHPASAAGVERFFEACG